MKMENKFFWLRNVTAFCLMVAVFAATSLVASAAPEKNVSMGELIVSGSSVDGNEPAVMLNGEKAFSGRTFFSSGTIATTEKTSATVNLGKLGSVSLSPNSVLSLNFDKNTINGTLTAGQINVANSEGVNVNIVNTDGSAIISQGGLYNANTDALPSKQDDDNKVGGGSQLALIAVFAGVVAVAAIYVLTRDDNNVGTTVSPVR
jgi:hypothetical protein